MSSNGTRSGGVLLSDTQKPVVVVQVDKFSVQSPTAEGTDSLSGTVNFGKNVMIKHDDNLQSFSRPATRSRTDQIGLDAQLAASTANVQRSSSHEMLWCPETEDDDDTNSPSRRRAPGMQLPSFRSLGIASADSEYFGRRPLPAERHTAPPTRSSVAKGRTAAQSLPLLSSESARAYNLGSTPLLTPPEDADSIKWNNALMHNTVHPQRGDSFSLEHPADQVMATSSEDQQRQPAFSTSSQPRCESNIEMQSRAGNNTDNNAQQEEDGNDGSPNSRVIRPFISNVVGHQAQVDNIHIIAQVLPQPALDTTKSKPAFEKVVEAIQNQQNSDEVAYITLTHAVPPKFEMKDLPTSPPATPNLAHGRDDYFGQTIFTNAATVAAYHGHKRLLNNQAPPSPNTIVAPSSIHLSVLERYIPPTSPFEYADFFDSRSHSILVDRLAELSVRGGRLLLLYPTKRGAETFMSSYLNQVMDPFLREFIFLNNLYFQLGTTLGAMSAVSSMLDFADMEHRLHGLCRAISRKASFRGGPSSAFTLIYSTTGASTIDTKTWKEWYVNQETARIKENLYEYAKMGGRMPPEVNHHQITPSVLARQVVDGIQESNRVSGGVPIELGMFVIERTRN